MSVKNYLTYAGLAVSVYKYNELDNQFKKGDWYKQFTIHKSKVKRKKNKRRIV